MTKPNGNFSSNLMFVGEAPGKEEAGQGTPFVGSSGRLLGQLAYSSGLLSSSPSEDLSPRQMQEFWAEAPVLLTNVARERPPSNKIDNFFLNKTQAKKNFVEEVLGRYPSTEVREGMELLYDEIDKQRPHVIVAFGNTSLWALTGHTAVTSWRGSVLESIPIRGRTYKVIPTIHPALVLRRMDWKQLLAHDLRARVAPELKRGPEIPQIEYNFITKPSYEEAVNTLEWLLSRLDNGEQLRLASDIETYWGQIACEGIAWSTRDAISIPIVTREHPYSYWPDPDQEAYLIWKIKRIHQHPNALIVGQNFNYDRQYFAKIWGFWSSVYMDTMTAHHTCWPSMKKSLEFLSSLYADIHVYWKDESKEWDQKIGEEQLWIYNCKDVCVTYEVSEKLEDVIDARGIRENYEFQMRMRDHVLRAWARGIKYDVHKREQVRQQLQAEIERYQQWFIDFLGTDKLNPKAKAYYFDSDTQLKEFLYGIMKVKKVISKKTGNPTADKEALPIIAKREPLLKDFCQFLGEYRSLRVYMDTFVSAKIDRDGRWRMEQDVDGTETFRFASRKDGFGIGQNTQNLPKGKEDD